MSEQNVNMAPLREAREALLVTTQKFNNEIEGALTRESHSPLNLMALAGAMQAAWEDYDEVVSTYMNRVRETQTLGRKIQ